MFEQPLYFSNGPHELFGIFHEPARGETRLPFIFCHPFAEEKLWAHRVFVSYARQLAAEGHAVLRFDYMGNGDSDGAFSQSSLETALSDVRRAITVVTERTGASSVNLLGLRLGATIAALVAEHSGAVERLILWAPITHGGRYMQEVLRSNLSTQLATLKEVRQDREALVEELKDGKSVNVDGYELMLPMYSEVSAVRLTGGRKKHRGPCLVVQIDRQLSRPAADLQALAGNYPEAELTFAQEEPFWKEIAKFYGRASELSRITSAWLASGAEASRPACP